ncbi:unnamed protein product [Brassica oleracea]
MTVHPNPSKACVSLVYDSADIFTICAPKKDKVPPPSSKPAKSGGGKQKKIVASELTKSEFKRLEDSPLNPIVKLGMREGINFFGKLFQFLMEKRVERKGNMMWFTFASQLMRFSERESSSLQQASLSPPKKMSRLWIYRELKPNIVG